MKDWEKTTICILLVTVLMYASQLELVSKMHKQCELKLNTLLKELKQLKQK